MKRFKIFLVALLAFSVIFAFTNASSPTTTPKIYTPPTSVAALGDSITQAANACEPWKECPEVSWSTGTNVEINSISKRLSNLPNGVETKMKVYNNARSYTKSSDLPNQASLAVSQNAEFITILSGSNDICEVSEEAITSDVDFRKNIQETLHILNEGLSKSKIYMLSIPNIYNLWKIGKDTHDAVIKWNSASLCASMLSNPTSIETEDMERRERVLERLIHFNEILREECVAATNCLYDENKTFDTNFTVNEISKVDYFHPSLEGQQRIAEQVWDFYVPVHALILRGSSKRSSDDAPIVDVISPKDKETVYGTKYIATVKVDSKYTVEKVYADTQIGSVNMNYDKNKDLWFLELDTTLAPDGISTFFTVVAVDIKGGIAVSDTITVTVNNKIQDTSTLSENTSEP
jgi:lysophospholipase L1-like esterase